MNSTKGIPCKSKSPLILTQLPHWSPQGQTLLSILRVSKQDRGVHIWTWTLWFILCGRQPGSQDARVAKHYFWGVCFQKRTALSPELSDVEGPQGGWAASSVLRARLEHTAGGREALLVLCLTV